MIHRAFVLADGKYTIRRNSAGLVVAVERNGLPWPVGFEQLRYHNAFNAALDRIEQLEDALRLFTKAATPVSTDIDQRGHSWSEAYLDAALQSVPQDLISR